MCVTEETCFLQCVRQELLGTPLGLDALWGPFLKRHLWRSRGFGVVLARVPGFWVQGCPLAVLVLWEGME